MMSWGRHFSALNYFLFDHLPMYNKFRTPSMIMTIPAFTFMFIAIWGLHEFLFGKNALTNRFAALKKSAIITGAICLLVTLGSQMFLSFKGENDEKQKNQLVQMFQGNKEVAEQVFSAIKQDRPSIAFKDGVRSIIFIGLSVVILFLYSRQKLKAPVALTIIGLLMSIDGISIGLRYYNSSNFKPSEDFEQELAPRPVDMEIKKDPDPYYRVFDVSTDTYNDAVGAVHHKLVGGYSPAKMEVYQDLIDMQLSSPKLNAEVLNMLNTKYIIFNGPDQKPVFQPNAGACGNAWFVKNIKLVNSADEEMVSLNAQNLGDTAVVANPFRPKEVAIMRKEEWKNANTSFLVDSGSNIKLTKYGLNDLTFESSNSNPGFAVFSDIYYKNGWKAYIDKKEADILKVNYVLRGLSVPEGKHTIRFEFKPESFTKWDKICGISSILVFLAVAAGIGLLLLSYLKRDSSSLDISNVKVTN
jgi:Bacterial membrane protein YfhO